MWIRPASLMLALGLTAAMLVVGHIHGYHSTPAFWLALLGFPGLLVATWAQWLVGGQGDNEFLLAILMTPVNWIFYFYIFKGVVAVRRRLAR